MEPELRDYLRLFASSEASLEDLDRQTDYACHDALFERLVRYLAEGSSLNRSLPEAFTRAARNYLRGEPGTVAYLQDPIHRHFMLCDVYDYILMRASQTRMRAWAELLKRSRRHLRVAPQRN